jgi:hypothetical protein
VPARRRFALVDCSALYGSCERAFDPSLERKPVAVLSNYDGCVVARTDEVRAAAAQAPPAPPAPSAAPRRPAGSASAARPALNTARDTARGAAWFYPDGEPRPESLLDRPALLFGPVPRMPAAA